MKKNFCKSAIGLMISAGIANAGVTLVLDDYDSDPNGDALGAGTLSSIVFNNPFSQGSDFTLDTMLNTGMDVGALVFNSGIGVEQGGSISYNSNGAGLNYNGVANGTQAFELDFAMVDQAFQANIVMTTYDDMGNAVGDARWAILVNAGTNITATWSFADFIIINGDFDAANIDDITLNLNLEEGATASLDFVATEFRAVVPAPGAVVLLSLGGLLISRRERL